MEKIKNYEDFIKKVKHGMRMKCNFLENEENEEDELYHMDGWINIVDGYIYLEYNDNNQDKDGYSSFGDINKFKFQFLRNIEIDTSNTIIHILINDNKNTLCLYNVKDIPETLEFYKENFVSAFYYRSNCKKCIKEMENLYKYR